MQYSFKACTQAPKSATTYTCLCDLKAAVGNICRYTYFYTTVRSYSVAWTNVKC